MERDARGAGWLRPEVRRLKVGCDVRRTKERIAAALNQSALGVTCARPMPEKCCRRLAVEASTSRREHSQPPTTVRRFAQVRAPSHVASALVNRSSAAAAPSTMANALQAIYKWAVPLAVGASFAQAAMYDVKGGTRAVIFDRLSGVRENVVNEGTHFLVPWLQRAIVYDVRTKPRNISTTTGSKDLQMVSLTLRVLHRPEVKMLPRIYQVRF